VSGKVSLNMNKALEQFWSTLKEANLIVKKFPRINDQYDLKNMGGKYPIILGISKLKKQKQKIIDNRFSNKEFDELMLNLEIYYLTTELETIKDVFALMLNKNKLKIKQDNDIRDLALGTVIGKVNDVLYPNLRKQKKMRDNNRDLFFVDFRNAIIHRNFVYQGTFLTYRDRYKKLHYLSAEKLRKMSEKIQFLSRFIIQKANDMH